MSEAQGDKILKLLKAASKLAIDKRPFSWPPD
jgi:hypothetical protein